MHPPTRLTLPIGQARPSADFCIYHSMIFIQVFGKKTHGFCQLSAKIRAGWKNQKQTTRKTRTKSPAFLRQGFRDKCVLCQPLWLPARRMISSAATSSALYAATNAQGKPASAGASPLEKPAGRLGLASASLAAGAEDAAGASDGAAVLWALSPLLPALPPKEALLVSMSSGMLAGGVNPSALEKSG